MNDETELRARLADSDPAVAGLVLAAFRGDEELDATLATGTAPQPPTKNDDTEPEATESPDVFLESIEVAGFRGVGRAATLELRPRPGLTLVIGRNGSGKSSFAEAAELALTDDSMRWAGRPVVFREGWRNLHHDGDTEITVRLRLGGDHPPVTIRRHWDASAKNPEDASRQPAVAPDWLGKVGLYRPFLSARDLERVITAKPAELYDALAPILGLGPLAAADTRLQARRKEREDRVKVVKTGFSQLKIQLTEVDDDRAEQALKALGGRAGTADLTTLARLAAGDGEGADASIASAARRLLDDDLPNLAAALDSLAVAQQDADRLGGSESVTAGRTADLLRRALDHHEAEGDQRCPVCRTGHLDAVWRAEAEAAAARLEAAAAESRSATDRVETARRAVEENLALVRRELSRAGNTLASVLPEQADQLREVLSELPGTAAGVAAVRTGWERVVTAYAELAEAATRWLVRRQNVWQEPAAALRRWLAAAEVVQTEAGELGRLVAARAALGAALDGIRGERLAAFVGQSEHIWRRLRQESNVELREMRMEGANTQRRVRFPVTVDGSEANALAVMSQGELHALGLSVFLPRAAAEASPYRFVIVDDPVQSMDPAKVDGLAEVLGEIAQNRQVVVFTHDDRLPEAIRRLGLEATVWEVSRRARSVVELRMADDPADRYLADAYALAAAQSLPEDARYPVVAGFCRSALEAASMDAYRARRYREGATHRQVERKLAAAKTAHQRLTLTLLDDLQRGDELYRHLDQTYGGWAADTLRAVAEGAHGTRRASMTTLVKNTSDLVERLR
jgi:energy-coupling factor transporter ATP-binding protein EcfA2